MITFRKGSMILLLLFVVAVQILSLALMAPLSLSEVRVFEDPGSATNPFSYLLFILGFTIFLLVTIRLGKGWLIGWIILLAVALSVYYVSSPFMPQVLAASISLFAVLLLHFYPEWYLVDFVGVIICAGVSTLFGISMETGPALLLLIVLAFYDAISVYKTRHMVALAEGVMDIKAPLLFIAPKRSRYSFRKEEMGAGNTRGAYFLGLGDAIIPTVLMISANWSLHAPYHNFGGIAVNTPAIGAMLGTCIGFIALMNISEDHPQAGLPFLNGGAILGFLVGCLASGVVPI